METFGQYVLIDKVASGGMAELFKAKKLGIEGFERVLAIKRILPHISSDEEFVNMFISEAKLVAQLSHKNIAQIYDFGKIGSDYFIAMEYVRGKDLRTVLRRCQEKNIVMPANLALFIAKEVLSALGSAHRQKDSMGKDLKLIHRDVSPQNILIAYEGEVKVIDFGIAKAETHSHTKTGTIKGKLSYMSPEQAWGKPIDHRSDIFSLGIVLYEMLTGKRLFKGETEINTLEKVREAKVEPFAPLLAAITPSELESIVLKALAKDVRERYQDAASMEADLGKILFVLSSADPAVELKNFMARLFNAEIDAECKTEIEGATKSIRYDHKVLSKPKSRTIRTTQGEEGTHRSPRRAFPYVIFATALIAIAVTVFFIWPDTVSEHKLPPPSSDGRITHHEQAGQSGSDADKQKTALASEQSVNHKENEQTESGLQESTQSARVKETPPAITKGNITINATPWADIYINGKHYGATPKTIKALPTGRYSIKLENPNFDAWSTNVTVAQGKTANISHRFEGFGKIIVNAVPWGNVYVDGVLKGQTPITIQRVPARVHEITVSKDGFREIRKAVEVKAGESKSISVRLERKVQ